MSAFQTDYTAAFTWNNNNFTVDKSFANLKFIQPPILNLVVESCSKATCERIFSFIAAIIFISLTVYVSSKMIEKYVIIFCSVYKSSTRRHIGKVSRHRYVVLKTRTELCNVHHSLYWIGPIFTTT